MLSDHPFAVPPGAALPPSRDLGFGSRWILACGVLLALAVAAMISWAAWADRAQNLRAEQQQLELLARALDEHATRTLETGSVALAGLALAPAFHGTLGNRAQLEETLQNLLVGLPFMRSLAVIDERGMVLASTDALDRGVQIELRRLGPWPAQGRDQLGRYVSGRSLAVLRPGASAAAPPGIGFLPLMRSLDGSNAHLLVGLLNPDAFGNYSRQLVGEGERQATLLSYRGDVLAGSQEMARFAGSNAARLPVFAEYLPRREAASYQGTGLGGTQRMVAFRTSRNRPLVSMIEQPIASAQARWIEGAQGYAAGGAGATAVILALTVLAWRSARARETARQLRDEAQARVVRSEQEMAVVMRSVQELMFRTDAQGAITFVNARWSRVTGSEPGAAVGRCVWDIVEPDCRDAIRALFQGAGIGVRSAQARVRAPDGRMSLFDVAVVPLRLDGELAGFAGSAVDVTERWNAQQALQSQLALSERLLEVNPLPIAMTDPDGRLLLVNQAWEAFKGLRRETAIGCRLKELLPAEEALAHAAADKSLLVQGGTLRYETRVRPARGTPRDTRIVKALVPKPDGSAAGVLSVLMDVTEFREAERATREAQDAMEETVRAKAEFVANMSHELRTPLQSIIGFSEIGKMRGKHEPRLASMFEDIHAAGQRMLALVNDLLDVSKLESTVGTFDLERVDLRGPMRSVVREFGPLLEPRRLDLRLELGEMPLLAKADPLRFEQVMRNVIANAVKFSPEGGTIRVTGEATVQGELHLCVRDEGPGIPEEEIERVFDAFVQSSKTKDGSGGTGLGLAICRKIVEAHGGRIFARNIEPRGAAFHIHLPMRTTAETVPAPLE